MAAEISRRKADDYMSMMRDAYKASLVVEGQNQKGSEVQKSGTQSLMATAEQAIGGGLYYAVVHTLV